MTIEFIPAICPNCGGELRVPEDRKIIKCMYCGYDIIIHETKNNPPQPSVENLLKLAEDIVDSNPEEAYEYFAKVLEVEIDNWKAWYGKAKSISAMYEIATSEISLNKALANTRINEIVHDVKKAIEYCPENEMDKLIESANRLLFPLALQYKTNLNVYSLMQYSNALDLFERSIFFFNVLDYDLLIKPTEDYIFRAEYGMQECEYLINKIPLFKRNEMRNRYQSYLNKIKEVDPTYRPNLNIPIV